MRDWRAHALVALFASAIAVPAALADDKVKAAEHFARAQSAEKSQDWDRAITEYKSAYELSPHPSVLYNIGVNHERLGQLREASRYFLRYLNDDADAEDREEVLARVAALRERPCTATFEVKPAAATLYVDGGARGEGTQTLDLSPGRHQVHAARAGRRSPARQVLCEYGETLSVAVDLDALPGTLQVDANVEGAEVRVDGNVIGQTPFLGPVPAGDHMVLVSMAGYRSEQRQVSIPPQGSEQVRANLEPLDNKDGGGSDPADSGGRHKFLLGSEYGFDGADGYRAALALGYRTPGDRFEAALLLGRFGADLGSGAGGALRFYFATASLRPYLRAGVILGDNNQADGGSAAAVESGLGILWTHEKKSQGPYRPASGFGLEYFLEVSAQLDVAGEQGLMEEGSSRFALPVLFGLLVRFG